MCSLINCLTNLQTCSPMLYSGVGLLSGVGPEQDCLFRMIFFSRGSTASNISRWKYTRSDMDSPPSVSIIPHHTGGRISSPFLGRAQETSKSVTVINKICANLCCRLSDERTAQCWPHDHFTSWYFGLLMSLLLSLSIRCGRNIKFFSICGYCSS